MLVDLHHDRLLQSPPIVVADVQAAVIFDSDTLTRAGRAIGLTKVEYDEFERRVMEGDVRDGYLPERLDAMSGRGRTRGVYALKVVHVHAGERSFIVSLSDGARVYVPRVCGNLSVVRGAPPPHVAVHKKPHYVQRRHIAAVPPPHYVAAAQVAQAPQPVPAPMVAAVPPVVTAVAAIPKAHVAFPFIPFIAWVGGGIGSVVGAGPSTSSTPSCGTPLASGSAICIH
jgi:hypothetical protein